MFLFLLTFSTQKLSESNARLLTMGVQLRLELQEAFWGNYNNSSRSNNKDTKATNHARTVTELT
eukprot:4997968-Amphidinium_carterae.1